jgi:dipeptidyl aminopeptidase/acylaminoacyl peptidase
MSGTMRRVAAKTVLAAMVMMLWAMAGLRAQERMAGKRAITFEDLAAMKRVSDPQISPDGKWVVYAVAQPDLAANKSHTDVWMVATTGGNEPRQITQGGSDGNARWSPDGKQLAFLSARKGSSQVYVMGLDGGEARQVTNVSGGADEVVWSPDGKTVAFTSRVYTDCKDDACNAARDEAKDQSKVKARVYDRLLYRHWTQWWDGKRSHLFVVSVTGGTPRDLTPGADYDVPPFSLGGPEAIAFSPDGRELCFTANTDKDEAASTNGDLFVVPVTGASSPERITDSPGNDWGPVYSPDGKRIAYRSQKTAGYESDHWRLMVYNRQEKSQMQVAAEFDRNPESYAWSRDSRMLYFQAEDRAQMPLFEVEVATGAKPRVILKDGFNAEFSLSANGKTMAFTRTSLQMPSEMFAAESDGTGVRQLSHHNAALLAHLDLPAPEPFWFDGAEGAKVEGLLLKPPHFDASKKYPMLLLVHGGPQGAWDDEWGYRWNPQLMASPGYVVAMINPRGSTGYGQKFTAEISGDWGGRVFTDLMNGVDYVSANTSYVDGQQVCAAGGSYGGYMIDWMASHAKGRFKCLISHAGPYDAVSMYGATEELWFENWEFKGTPWGNPELFAKWSPSTYAGEFGKYKTPVLVIAGERDFRVPYTQSLEFFTALQVQGVPSKLMIFPDEGHWVLKPQNSQLWYHTFLEWLGTYLK